MAWQGRSPASVTITSDATTVATIPIREGASNLWFEVALTSAARLTGFTVAVDHFSDTSFHTVADTADDYISDFISPLLWTGTNPASLAKSGTSLIWMGCKGLANVRFAATAPAASDAVASYTWRVR